MQVSPLVERFLAVLAAVWEDKSLFENGLSLRCASLSLAQIEGEPAELAEGLRCVARELSQRSGWFGPLKGDVRFVLAALIIAHGGRPEEFVAQLDEGGELLRLAGLRRGSVYEVLAVFMLRTYSPEGRVTRAQVERFRAIYDEMRKHHRWLTSPDDYPACALLTVSSGDPVELGERAERFYAGLRVVGLHRGNRLQTVTHLLLFNPAPDEVCIERFAALWQEFRGRSLFMHEEDYDEVALLTFLDRPAAELADQVLAVRDVLHKTRPKPGRELAFWLAASLVFVERLGPDPNTHLLRDAQSLLQALAILQAQQAATVMAAAAASTSAST